MRKLRDEEAVDHVLGLEVRRVTTLFDGHVHLVEEALSELGCLTCQLNCFAVTSTTKSLAAGSS